MSYTATQRRHPLLWFDDGDLVLQLDNVLFNLHRFLITRNSALFKDMLSLPQSETPDESMGGTISRPLLVPDIPPKPFAHLVGLMYSMNYLPLLETYGSDAIDDGEMVELFSVAHRLQCDQILLQLARTILDKLPPMRKLGVCVFMDLDGTRARVERECAAEEARWRLFEAARTAPPATAAPSLSYPLCVVLPDDSFSFNAFVSVVHDTSIQQPFDDPDGMSSSATSYGPSRAVCRPRRQTCNEAR
ncbi:hypothetical protein BKA62DRAFT_456867 [Auriculariales sp. MPI-PUGE-AT-0066]|nr:hypothetical protein BKA62DRAFT_456867 [Auriculariales sp. MPI-PUGE-AT-0066]